MFFRFLYRIAPFTLAAYGALLAAVSLLPAAGPPVGYDKLMHAVAYALFPLAGAPLALEPRTGRRPMVYLGAGAVAWGAVLEICQHFLPGRVMSAGDIAANSIGAACGIGVLLLLRRAMPDSDTIPVEAESP